MLNFKYLPASLGALVLSGAPALAHHPLGGGTPETFGHGLLSGVGHPMLGIDHFAFIVAMAFAAVAMGRLVSAPLAFLGASLMGVLIAWGGVQLPMVELIVALSATVIGVIVLSGRTLSLPVALSFFAFAGLFHGHAYGGAIIGAEPTPVVAYLIGLFAVQYAIALAAGFVAMKVWSAASARDLPLRLAGGVTAGIGFTFLFENLETMAFGPVV